MVENEEHLFTCKDCGAHDLKVVTDYDVTTYYEETLACECENGETSGGEAARLNYHVTTAYSSWGYLDDEHRWEEEEEEDIDDGDTERDEYEEFCEKCVEDAHPNDWEITEEEDDNREYYVRCGGCDREIEFGWSHDPAASPQGWGGRIWPAECTDFNPWKSWPEPRYKESWAKKGWIRPCSI